MKKIITEKELVKNFGHLEDHQYRHYNSALGCFVEGKEHFRKLMSQGKFIPYEKACRIAEEHDCHKRKDYKISENALSIIQSVKLTKDKNGNIKLGGRAIKALEEMGVIPSKENQKRILKTMKDEKLI